VINDLDRIATPIRTYRALSRYRVAALVDVEDLALMRRIDELYMAWRFLGPRRMAAMLRSERRRVNRERVRRLMRRVGIAALGPKPRTTTPAPGHAIYPDLLREMVIDRPHRVWAAHITYIPSGRGFLYLVAVMTGPAGRCWHGSCRTRWTTRAASRGWRRRWCALAGRRSFNTDKGSQFTSAAFAGTLAAAGVRISMDWRGR
jgi:putative transposase